MRDKAEKKWSSYHSDCYQEGAQYMLVFEDRQCAQFLPGTVEFLTLRRYKEEIGRDYKGIVLYLCTEEHYKLSTGEFKEDSSGAEDGKPPKKQTRLHVEKFLGTNDSPDKDTLHCDKTLVSGLGVCGTASEKNAGNNVCGKCNKG